MIQRIIFSALQNGLAAPADNPSLYDTLFTDNYGLDPAEVAEIKVFFNANPVHLYHGYPPEEPKFPSMTILLQGEEQSDVILSHSAGIDTDPTSPTYRSSIHSAFWHHTYQILNYSENIDVTSYMYEICKSCIVSSYDYLRKMDVDDITISGMDLAPDMVRLPAHLFVRALQIRCRRELIQQDVGIAPGTAFQMGNVALPSGSPQSNGGITPTVSVGNTSNT